MVKAKLEIVLVFLGAVMGFLLASMAFVAFNLPIAKNIYANKTSAQRLDAGNLSIGSSQSNQLLNITMGFANATAQKDIYNATLPKYGSSFGFLSPRIYAGVLEPRSFLITNFEPLKSGLISFLQDGNISASVYVENLRNGASMGIHEKRGYFPASLNKLPVAILIMQKVEDGKFSLDTNLTIHDYERASSYGTLYLTPERKLPVRVLLEKMLEESDNTAFNVLLDNVDRSELQQLLDYMSIKENFEYPSKRVEYQNPSNLITPIGMYNIFSSLYLSTVLYAQDSEYILSLLTKTTDYDVNSAADIPANVVIADKFGEYYLDDIKLFHDCGIIYIGNGRFFYCIMMEGVELEDARQYIGYMVGYIYNYITDTRVKLNAFRHRNSTASTAQ